MKLESKATVDERTTIVTTESEANHLEAIVKGRMALLMGFNGPDGLTAWEEEYCDLARILRRILTASRRPRSVSLLDFPTDDGVLYQDLGMDERHPYEMGLAINRNRGTN